MKGDFIIGADECGTGSWVGPAFIGAVRAPRNWTHPGLKDSKKLSRGQRERLSLSLEELIADGIIEFAEIRVCSQEIDRDGLGVAHRRAIGAAINSLLRAKDEVIVDGNLRIGHYGIETVNARSVIGADDLFPTVSAASILIKHHRDGLLVDLAKEYPGYGWEKNAGYINEGHKQAVRELGLTEVHRKSYKVIF